MNLSTESTKEGRNRLKYSKSPYLLQHANNPVDWYPWGKEPFRKAREENKPVFLSIGYATCHWCHVMARETFDNEGVAKLLNESFVSIKVDREERPDVDQIYMKACQAITGQGGWPLSVFLTPEGKPFFAGTYFPRTSRMGMQGFQDLLVLIRDSWHRDQDRFIKAGNELTRIIQPESIKKVEIRPLNHETLARGFAMHVRSFDREFGGFGQAPKFPTPLRIRFLLRWYAREKDPSATEMIEKTLDHMRRGGIFDQIGYGFHRYSVDKEWKVPHFEKMLYDQALLAIAYTEAYQALGRTVFMETAGAIFTYVLREMTAPEGGFYSAQDADTEGKEGFFFLWTAREILDTLGRETGDLFNRFFGVREEGNFQEGQNILYRPLPLDKFAEKEGMGTSELKRVIGKACSELFVARQNRIYPLKDDKILTSWNGLMIAALAKAFAVTGRTGYIEAAGNAMEFVLHHMVDNNGRLLRRFRQGDADLPGYLDDYSFLVWGLLELYEATFNSQYLSRAMELSREMLAVFQDNAGKRLYYTGKGNETLIARSREAYDAALPSGNSVAVMNLLRLARMTGATELEENAEGILHEFSDKINQHPTGFTEMLCALDFHLGPSRELVIAGHPENEHTRRMIRILRSKFRPRQVAILKPPGSAGSELISLAPYVREMAPVKDRTTAYICQGFTCRSPITDLTEFESEMNK